MRRRALLLLLTASFLAAAVFADQFPTVARGLSPNKQYSFGEIDSINSFNGNLSLSIPIGLQYPVNGSLKYGLVLHYNSKVWDYEKRNVAGSDYTSVVPNRDSNAGMGWILDLGRMASPHDSSNPLPDDTWNYLSPDGARHSVGASGGLHPGSNPTALSGNVTAAGYSHDGQYFRMLTKSDGSKEIDTPDGIARSFDGTTGNLNTMSDPFGNSITLTKYYTAALTPCPSSDVSAWVITDSQNRTNYVCFANTPYAYTESAYDGQFIDRVILTGPLGQQATYQFQYSFLSIGKGCGGNYPYDPVRYNNLPMLTGLLLPDGSSYTFTYNPSSVNGCDQGTLASVALPTGATINYTYREYQTPVDPCPDDQSAPHVPRTFSDVVGVGQKTITGPNIPAGMTWTWTSELTNSNLFVQCLTHSGPLEFYIHVHAPSDQAKVTITNPDASVTEHYYSVWPGSDALYQQNPDGSWTTVSYGYPVASENGALINEYGLPFTRLTPSANRFLSTRRYSASGGTLLRSEYVRYESDDNTQCFQLARKMLPGCLEANQRSASTQIVYHDDGGRTADTDQSDFDGVGNYRTIVTNGTFSSGNVRTSYTDFNSGADANGNIGSAFAFPSSAKWVTTTHGDQWLNENSHTSKTESCFDSTGFLKKRRFLRGDAASASGISESANDVLVVYTNDGYGNVAKEQYFGGDTCGTSTLIQGCSSASTCPPTGVAICDALNGGGTPAYDIHHTYSYGVLSSTRYYQCDDATPVNFKSIDRDIDASGLVRHERDAAGVQTEYGYDSSGRLLTIASPGESTISYTYSNAAVSGNTLTPATLKAVRGTVESDYQYDAFGRLWREKQLMPDNTWSLRETLYDAPGHILTVSDFETIPNPATEFTFHPAHQSQFAYDVFNRPLSVQTLDGYTTSYEYTGDSSSTQTVTVATASGLAPAKTVKSFDRQGRMTSITEGYQTSLEQTTNYGYDVGGRLASVTMGVQSRAFNYDGRGFLTSETHPENGTTTYQNYDAKGHAGLKLLPGQTQFDLRFNFDSAERVWLLEGRNPYSPSQFRTLKQFTFGPSNNGSDLVNGKLQTAMRKNYDTSLGTSTVTETFQYADTAGRLTSKTTSISGDALPTQSVTQAYTYNDLGEVATVTYPKCTGSVPCTQPAWASPSGPDVTAAYTAGLLSSVSAPNSFRPSLGSLSYAPNGLVKTITHSNGVTDTQTPDPSGLPRLQNISVNGWSSCTPPSITGGPGDATLPPGNSGTTLTVNATGTGTLHYLWQGPAGAIAHDYPWLDTGPITQASSYSVKVTDDCGVAQSRTATVTVCDSPTATITSGSTTILPGNSAQIQVALTGSGPWILTWSDGVTTPNINSSPYTRTVWPASTTPYSVTSVRDYYCYGTSYGSATVTVALAAPGNFSATTVQNNTLSVSLQWSPVNGAQWYQVERATIRGGMYNPTGPRVTATSSSDSFGAAAPTTYLYSVRAGATFYGVDTLSDPSNIDYATVATALFTEEPLVAGLTAVKGVHAGQLRQAIDAVRRAAGLQPFWTSYAAATGRINASDNTIMRQKLDEAAVLIVGHGVAYSGAVPGTNGPIYAYQWQQIRNGVR